MVKGDVYLVDERAHDQQTPASGAQRVGEIPWRGLQGPSVDGVRACQDGGDVVLEVASERLPVQRAERSRRPQAVLPATTGWLSETTTPGASSSVTANVV